MKILNIASDNPIDFGVKIGEKLKKEIQRRVRRMVVNDYQRYALLANDILKLGLDDGFAPLKIPFQELIGIAKGAGVASEQIFILNFFEYEVERCTTIYDGHLLGHNEDELIGHELVFIKAVLGSEKIFALMYPGQLLGNSFAINATTGAVSTVNYIPLIKPDIGKLGISSGIFDRISLGLENWEQFSAVAGLLPIKDGWHQFFYVGGRAYSIEFSPFGLVKNLIPADCDFVHTNHFLSDDLRAKCKISESSYRRFELACLMFEEKKLKGRELFSSILSSHRGICRHGRPEDEGKETLASVLVDLDRKNFVVFDGRPCENKVLEIITF